MRRRYLERIQSVPVIGSIVHQTHPPDWQTTPIQHRSGLDSHADFNTDNLYPQSTLPCTSYYPHVTIKSRHLPESIYFGLCSRATSPIILTPNKNKIVPTTPQPILQTLYCISVFVRAQHQLYTHRWLFLMVCLHLYPTIRRPAGVISHYSCFPTIRITNRASSRTVQN